MNIFRLRVSIAISLLIAAMSLSGCGSADDQLSGNGPEFQSHKKVDLKHALKKLKKKHKKTHKKKQKHDKHHEEDQVADDDCDTQEDPPTPVACGGVTWSTTIADQSLLMCESLSTLSPADLLSLENNACAYLTSGQTTSTVLTTEEFCTELKFGPPPPPPPP